MLVEFRYRGSESLIMGLGKRISFAFRCFFSLLFRGEIPEDIARRRSGVTAPAATISGAAPAVSAPAAQEPVDRAIQVLALLQRDGRLIDFLSEDVAPYPDAQLGAATRAVHDSCRQVLDRYFKLEPIMASDEDQTVTVPLGFDPATIKLVGNVSGKPPFRGLLRHRGWCVRQANLPSLPEGTGRSVIAPAEVEISN
jgi:Domain of unknown function (DUF2760)